MTTPQRTAFKWLTRAFLVFLYYGSALAAVPAYALEALDASHHGQGLLWKITPPKGRPSFVFGTIHSDDPRVLALPKAVASTLDRSRSFTMEIEPGIPALTVLEHMYFRDGRTLEGVIGKKRYAETRAALIAYGAPTIGMEKQKPWAVLMLLSAPLPKGQTLDFALAQRAKVAGKPVYGLETLEEQLAVFNEMSLEDQIVLLDDAVALHRRGVIADLFEQMMQRYLARDVAGVIEAAEAASDNQEAKRAGAAINKDLVVRNRRMAERALPRLQEGDAFIAVGAAHLPGREGLLALLERQGYRVSRIY